MVEIFSSDLADVCKSIQRTLDDSNGIANSTDYKSVKHQEIERYKYDDGRPFAIISTRFYGPPRLLDFCVSFDVEWYKKATKNQVQLIFNLNLNIKNREVDLPIFLYTYTFRNEIDEKEFHTSTSPLPVKYENCIIKSNILRYKKGGLMTFDNCIIVRD